MANGKLLRETAVILSGTNWSEEPALSEVAAATESNGTLRFAGKTQGPSLRSGRQLIFMEDVAEQMIF